MECEFFGPIKLDFQRALLDRDLFENKYQRLQANDLHQLAEQWRNNLREVWSISFDGIPAKHAETYKNALKEKLRDFDEITREPLLKRLGDTIKIVLDNGMSLMR
jgi:bisphosphoglycerate-dependent phosphoglycerate mutase